MAQNRFWTARFQEDPTRLPISFVYGSQAVAGLPASWNPMSTARRLGANLIETAYEATDSATGLTVRVEFLEYLDFPVVEWTAWFANIGEESTPILRDVLGLDACFAGSEPVLHHYNGDFYSEAGYTPTETPLPEGVRLTLTPRGGRPCDEAFPYFRLCFAGYGLTIAVGWPGQWSSCFAGLDEGVWVRAGQEQTHLRLLPGERIRTPRITLLSWTGGPARGLNLWRRWYLAHVLPRPHGQPLRPLLVAAGTEEGNEFTGATEENQLRFLDKYASLGYDFDIWWIDAGWYPCYNQDHERQWYWTGTWEPDPERFPHGLQPVSARAEEHGADLLVWFEPERVTTGSRLYLEHPEWLLHHPGSDEPRNALLNLGDAECRRWLTEHVCRLIQENGIRVYRQDFNFEPLPYWREHDAEDRQGATENFHVQGYLQYWDELLRRNPGLWIDSCASGGRRNDLETMRRAVPLHYSDYGYGLAPVKLAFQQTLYEWLPYFKDCTLSWDGYPPTPPGDRFNEAVDVFAFHCGMAPMLMLGLDIRRDDYDFDLVRRLVGLWRQAAFFMLYGDFYALRPWGRDADRWVAWQFDRPETGEGLLRVLRLSSSPEEAIRLRLHGLCAQVEYTLRNPENEEETRLAGSVLLEEGFPVQLPPRTAACWFYRREPASP